MKTCPECGHKLGLGATRGYCSYVCKILFRARRGRVRRERMRRFFAALFDRSLTAPQKGGGFGLRPPGHG